jgi:ribosomal protein S18 acetylase RimI-like enzyme
VTLEPLIRAARHADLPRLHPIIERAYRGESARAGWTHEADLIVEGERTDLDTLTAIIADPTSRLLMALDGDTPIGCVHIANRGDGLAYLGLLCVDPTLQAAGLGRKLIDAAEAAARGTFGCNRMEMTVIDKRVELIAWYARRGYTVTEERRPFPIPLDPPLFLQVLFKPL